MMLKFKIHQLKLIFKQIWSGHTNTNHDRKHPVCLPRPSKLLASGTVFNVYLLNHVGKLRGEGDRVHVSLATNIKIFIKAPVPDGMTVHPTAIR